MLLALSFDRQDYDKMNGKRAKVAIADYLDKNVGAPAAVTLLHAERAEDAGTVTFAIGAFRRSNAGQSIVDLLESSTSTCEA